MTDTAERRAIYARMTALSAQELPIIYLWNPKFTWGLSRKLSGFTPVADGIIRVQDLALAR